MKYRLLKDKEKINIKTDWYSFTSSDPNSADIHWGRTFWFPSENGLTVKQFKTEKQCYMRVRRPITKAAVRHNKSLNRTPKRAG